MNFKRNNPQCEFITVTPEIAQELLKSNTSNRRVRGWYVDLLAAAMRRGEWRETGQHISVDCNGTLIDSQHRLMACVKAGVSIRSGISMGLRTDAYEVIDTGIKRRSDDLMRTDKRISEAIRLATSICLGTKIPTVAQMNPVLLGEPGTILTKLIEHCGSSKKYYSSAPMRVAACVSVMKGEDELYVFSQYRALVTTDYDAMSACSKALMKQVVDGTVNAYDTSDCLARGMAVFSEHMSDLSRITVTQSSKDNAVIWIKRVIGDVLQVAPVL